MLGGGFRAACLRDWAVGDTRCNYGYQRDWLRPHVWCLLYEQGALAATGTSISDTARTEYCSTVGDVTARWSVVPGMKKLQENSQDGIFRREDELAALVSLWWRFSSYNACFGQQVYRTQHGCLVSFYRRGKNASCECMGFNATRSSHSGAKGCSFDDVACQVKQSGFSI